MCGKRLKTVLSFSALLLLLSFSPSSVSLFADVVLTDSEAQTIMNEIQLSKQELQDVKEELRESKTESQELKTELEDVRNTYNEQKKSYETQLNEAEKENRILKTCLTVTTTISVVLAVILLL